MLAIATFALQAAPALAAWPTDPTVNLPVCTASGSQQYPSAVSDGSGGAFIAWQDRRSGFRVYAQHVLTTGGLDPAWPVDGLLVCSNTGSTSEPQIVTDGNGGAIVAWKDRRSGNWDVYAHHILANGIVDPTWPTDGRALCTAASQQTEVRAAADGSGGAFVCWMDQRVDLSGDLYAHHVLASGLPDPSWPVDGLAVCQAANTQNGALPVTDLGGALVVYWSDFRTGVDIDCYATRVSATGTLDTRWPADGLAVCALTGHQPPTDAIRDDLGGTIVVWPDSRSGSTYDIYAQRLLYNGTRSWTSNGLPVCVEPLSQDRPALVSDGAGGAIVAWQDFRAGTATGVYAQHVKIGGSLDANWPAGGRALCQVGNTKEWIELVADGAGGAIVAWKDLRPPASADVYAQAITATGTIPASWPADGAALCLDGASQDRTVVVPDGVGGAIVAWEDLRNGIADIYAQRVSTHGVIGSSEPTIAAVADVGPDQGGRLRVLWDASVDEQAGAIGSYRLWRRGPATSWEFVAEVPAFGAGGYAYTASTAADSSAGGIPWNVFYVTSADTVRGASYASPADSGYSVDNLSPAPPAAFAARRGSGAATLSWNAGVEPDLAGYRLYRGSTPDFAPTPATLLSELTEPGFMDPSGDAWVYKLSSVDVHGNESAWVLNAPDWTVGAGHSTTPVSLWLGPVMPNPSAGVASIRFALPGPAEASLTLYDASGRKVRVLQNGRLEAGEHIASWDGRDAAGQRAAPGLYFVRLESVGCTLTRRLGVIR